MPESPNEPNTTPDGTPTVRLILLFVGAWVIGTLVGIAAYVLLHEPTLTRWPEPTQTLSSHKEEKR